jgi:hypothetical protein
VLAIFSEEAQEKYIPGSTEAAKNKSMILEFRVADIDQEYRRLQSFVKTWVEPPTTQPWGTRSIYFRDRVAEQAPKRHCPSESGLLGTRPQTNEAGKTKNLPSFFSFFSLRSVAVLLDCFGVSFPLAVER